jgi:two-component system sensor histidine kinase KdpD
VVTVQTVPSGTVEPGRFRDLAAELGCSFTLLEDPDVAGAITREAHRVRAAHVVIGELSGTSRLEGLRHHVADRIIDGLPDADVHVIAEAPRRAAHVARRSRDTGDERPDPEALLEDLSSDERREAILRVYLGHTRACGTTTAMLDEARLRAAQGADVVVAACRVEGDSRQALAGLELLGGTAGGRGELALDVDAVLTRKPAVVCVDDLAGPASQGGRTIDAVSRLLEAGVTVLGTLHLSSARDRPVRDRLLGMVDELEVIDLPPDELRERAGQCGAPGPEPQPPVLAALRVAALRMAADHSDRQVLGDLRRTGAGSTEIRGRVVLCLPPRPGLEARIRNAARYAHARDATFAVVSVIPDGRSAQDEALLDSLAAVTREVDGEFHCLQGDSLTSTLASFIRESLATEVIIGHRRSRWRPWDATSQLIHLLHGLDIHVLRR